MARYVWVVFTAPKEGQDDAYNDWYDNQHLADVVAIPGIVSAQRLELADMDAVQTALPRNLTLYEIETDDINSISPAIAAAQAEGRMPSTDALDRSAIRSGFYRPTSFARQRA